MKIIISRKVTFRKPKIETHKTKSESIINQYILEGEFDHVEHIFKEVLHYLNDDFTQQKGKR